MKTIHDLLPAAETALVQSNISKDLFEMVRAQMKKDGIKWRELLEACLRRYLEEGKK
jgi:hypothetical protein